MYRKVLNGFARQSLCKAPEIPDYNLMVGTAEHKASMPLLVYKNSKVPKSVVQTMNTLNTKASGEIEEMINNNTIEVNDFGTNVFFGGGLK